MEEVPKIIGQAAIAAGGSTDVLAPGAGVSFVVSSVAILGTGAGAAVVDVYPRKAGAAKAAATQMINDLSVGAGVTEVLKVGMTLGGDAGDVLTIDSTTNGVTVTVFGSEVTL